MTKLLIIGLDGVGKEVLDELCEHEVIPYIKSLQEQGSSSILESCIPCESLPAWYCLVSGQNPGEIGLFSQKKKQGNLVVPTFSFSYEAFWKKVPSLKYGIMGIPGTYPLDSTINGFMMSGSFTPNNADDFIHPSELKNYILDELQDFEFNPRWNVKEEVIPLLRSRSEKMFSMARKLLAASPVDVFMHVDNGTDIFQHYFKDETLEGSSRFSAKIKDEFYSYMSFLDAKIEALAKEIGAEHVLIVSDHGNHSYDSMFYVNRWLIDNGYLVLSEKKTEKKSLLSSLGISFESVDSFLGKVGLRKFVWNVLSGTNFHSFLPSKKGKTWNSLVKRGVIDFSKSKAYCLTSCGIYLNKDILSPEEYEQVRNQLILDINNNIPFSLNVLRKEEVYSGQFACEAPDVILYDPSFKIIMSTLLESKQLIPKDNSLSKTGKHHLDGIIVSNKLSFSQRESIFRVCSFITNYLNPFSQKEELIDELEGF